MEEAHEAAGIRRWSGNLRAIAAHRCHRGDRDRPAPSIAAGTRMGGVRRQRLRAGWRGGAVGPSPPTGGPAALAHRLPEKSRRLAGGLDQPRSNPSRMSMGDGAAGGFGRCAAAVSLRRLRLPLCRPSPSVPGSAGAGRFRRRVARPLPYSCGGAGTGGVKARAVEIHSLFIFCPSPWLCSCMGGVVEGCISSRLRIGTCTCSAPAFSNSRVSGTFWPARNGCFRSISMM